MSAGYPVIRRSIVRNPTGIVRNAIGEDIPRFLVPWILTMVSAVAVAVWEYYGRYGDQFRVTVATVVGLLFIGIGFSVALVAVGTLRGSYSSTLVIREDHRLVRHGIYGFVQHPVYSGAILVLMGLPLCLSSVCGTAVMLLVIPLFLNRIRIEERLLIEEFGAEYEAYMEATEKLVPLIY